MAITHSTAARNAAADAVTALLDAGSTNPNGQMIIRTAAEAPLATINHSATAYGAAVGGVCTAGALTDDTNANAGTAAIVTEEDRDNTEVWRGTVTATGGGGDLELSSIAIGAGDTVSISSATYTAPV